MYLRWSVCRYALEGDNEHHGRSQRQPDWWFKWRPIRLACGRQRAIERGRSSNFVGPGGLANGQTYTRRSATAETSVPSRRRAGGPTATQWTTLFVRLRDVASAVPADPQRAWKPLACIQLQLRDERSLCKLKQVWFLWNSCSYSVQKHPLYSLHSCVTSESRRIVLTSSNYSDFNRSAFSFYSRTKRNIKFLLHISLKTVKNKKAQLTQGLRATAPSFQDGRQPSSWILSNRK